MGCTFVNNTAAKQGSAIWAKNNDAVNLSNVEIEDRSNGGNSVYAEYGAIDTSGCKIITQPSFKIGTIADLFIGSPITIHVTETSKGNTFNGTVVVKIGDNKYNINIVNRKGSKTVTPNLSYGKHTAELTFLGTDMYYSANALSNTFSVTYKPKVVLSQSSVLYTGKYSATVYGKDGKLAKGTSVAFYVNGKLVKTVKTNSNGVAAFNMPSSYLPNKKYTIKAVALGNSASKLTSVKQILTIKKVKVKKSAKKLVLTATLSKVDGKSLKGKKIIFNFNGKKYTAKTNSKGIAKVTIKSKVLKKLKVGKKVKYQATYLKDTVKKTVKVKK